MSKKFAGRRKGGEGQLVSEGNAWRDRGDSSNAAWLRGGGQLWKRRVPIKMRKGMAAGGGAARGSSWGKQGAGRELVPGEARGEEKRTARR